MSLRQPMEVYGSLGKGMSSQVWEVWGVYGCLDQYMGSLCKCRAAYRYSRSDYGSVQEVYSSLQKSIVSVHQSR